MLVRQCNRCKKPIIKESYYTYEEVYHTGNGGFSVRDKIDLCKKCDEDFKKFLKGE